MRNYMRYQKAITIEDIKSYSKKTRGKFGWGMVLIIGLAVGALVIGYIVLTNPDALTNMMQGWMP